MSVVEHVLRIEDAEAQRKLRELGTAAGTAESGLVDLDAAATRTGPSLRKVGDAAEHMGERAGTADSIAQGLAGGLELVDDRAADAARTIGDTAGALEAIARLGSTALTILGPVAVAVGVLALVYHKLQGDVKDAEEAMKAANDEAERAQQISERLARVRIQAQQARGEISPEEAARELAQLEARAAFADQELAARDKVRTAKLAELEAEKALNDQHTVTLRLEQEVARTKAQNLGHAEGEVIALQAQREREEELARALEQRQHATQLARQAVDQLGVAEQGLADDLTDIATAKPDEPVDRLKKAADAAAPTAKEAAKAVKSLEEEMSGLEQIFAPTAISPGVARFRQELGGLVNAMAPQLSTLERLGILQAELNSLYDAGSISASEYTQHLDELGMLQAQAIADSHATSSGDTYSDGLTGGVGTATQAVGAVSGLASGSISGLGSLGGPWGQLIAALVQALELLGQQGADGIINKIEEMDTNITKGIEAIPEVFPRFIEQTIGDGSKMAEAFAKSLPDLIIAGVEATVEGFEAIMPTMALNIASALIEGLADSFGNPEFWDALWAGLAETLEEMWKNMVEAFKGLFTVADKEGGSGKPTAGRVALGVLTSGVSELAHFHTGGLNDRERVAVLQAGEIVDASPAMAGVRRGITEDGEVPMGGGGGNHFHFHGPVTGPDSVDWITREITSRLGTWGTATAPTPWGS